MKAMILAAGLGTRMRPLTENLPKPLIPVAGRPLIEYHVARCVAAGIRQLVINVSYLGDMIEAHLGSGAHWGVEIAYSREPHPLDVAGGLRQALPLLGCSPFWCLSADIYSDFILPDFTQLPCPDTLGHLILVDNPAHHQAGDFALAGTGDDQNVALLVESGPRYTFSGMALLDPKLLAFEPQQNRFAPVLRTAIAKSKLTGSCFTGMWSDVGTPERLAALERQLSNHL